MAEAQLSTMMAALKNLKNVQELRLLFCQQSPSSAGIREFVNTNYLAIKTANPKFPLLVREATGVEPKVVARFDFGVEKQAAVGNLSLKEVEQKIADLIKLGDSLPKSTESKPTIQ